MFTNLKAQILADEDSDVRVLSQEDIADIRRAYPGIPNDYVEFLRQIGWGAIAMSYVIYARPKSFPEVSTSEAILLIGDNMAGRFLGYDTTSWGIVEVLSDGSAVPTNHLFADVIARICEEILVEDEEA
ncbi:hypothetical protein [Bremerella sp.]|uniref:hypothetical protein n=1 Tax=Bremerella sp. TaxID=2795602 RepID=UPI00391C8171